MLNVSSGVADPQQRLTLSFLVHYHSLGGLMFRLHGLKAYWSIPLTKAGFPLTTGSYLDREREMEGESGERERIEGLSSNYRWKCTPAKTLLFLSEISQIRGCNLSLLWSHIRAWGASFWIAILPEIPLHGGSTSTSSNWVYIAAPLSLLLDLEC